MLTNYKRILLTTVAVVLVCTMITGCGGGGLLGSMLRIVGAAALVPDDWSSRGGVVRILADITGVTAVQRVIALVKHKDDPIPVHVELTLNDEGKYEGAYLAQENEDPVAADNYTVVVTATDAAGATAESNPIEFEVPPTSEDPTGE